MVKLDLGDNQIHDIQYLAPLIILEQLYLDKNQIEDIQHLASLVLLEKL